MAETEMTKDKILQEYMEFVLHHSEKNNTVYAFSKHLNIEEATFYSYFNGLKSIEIYFFEALAQHTISTLHQSQEYQNYDAREKLLSFYYTFFENLKANRSFVLYALHEDLWNLKKAQKLKSLRITFKEFFDQIHIDLLDFKNKEINKIQQKGIAEAAWIQLLGTLQFWLKDNSLNFEQTDIFIEKSVNTSFDLFSPQPIRSAIDFGKFLYHSFTAK